METMIDGIFSCGNCLHVHDVVDFVTDEGRLAGHSAALYINNLLPSGKNVDILPKDGISYVLPQVLNLDNKEDITIKFRVKSPVKDKNLIIECGDKILVKQFKSVLIPSEMAMVKISKDKLAEVNDNITVRLEDRK